MKTAFVLSYLHEQFPATVGNIKLTAMLKQLELDAMKEGMRRAALIASGGTHWIRDEIKSAINQAADALTEKDL